MLVVIGKDWIPSDVSVAAKLEAPNDFVRMEIEQGLSANLPLIPLLVDGVLMPAAQRLPNSINALSFKNAASLDHDTWDRDIRPVLLAVRRHLDEAREAEEAELAVRQPPPSAIGPAVPVDEAPAGDSVGADISEGNHDHGSNSGGVDDQDSAIDDASAVIVTRVPPPVSWSPAHRCAPSHPTQLVTKPGRMRPPLSNRNRPMTQTTAPDGQGGVGSPL